MAKGPVVQELNGRGAALCAHISALTSPAKKNGANKSGRTVGIHSRACVSCSAGIVAQRGVRGSSVCAVFHIVCCVFSCISCY